MISLFLSSLIVLILINQYVGARHHYQKIHQLLEEDVELQLIVDLMRKSIRHAGFTPCGNIDYLQKAVHDKEEGTLQALQIQMDNTPSLTIQRMDDLFDVIDEKLNSLQVIVPRAIFSEGQRVLIADCYHAEVKQIARVQTHRSGKVLTFTSPLFFNYIKPAYIGGWIRETYFMNSNNKKSSFYYRLNHAEELASYIEKMQVKQHLFQKKRLIEVTLGLRHEKVLHFSTMVRN